jgi:G6PDH family F420-dependent oxidoreductase
VPLTIGVSMTGDKAVDKLALAADHLINVTPERSIVDDWKRLRQSTGVLPEGRVIGQVPVCWDPDRDVAVKRAHEQFRWFAGGWAVNADLPTPAGFAGATQFVRPEDVASAIPCGPDIDGIVAAVDEYREAGFTDIALVQIGGDSQERFLDEAAKPLLAALRADGD